MEEEITHELQHVPKEVVRLQRKMMKEAEKQGYPIKKSDTLKIMAKKYEGKL